MTDEIRVALLCKGTSFEAWEAESIRQVKALPFVKLVLLIEEEADEIPPQSFFRKLAHYPYRLLLWRIYKRFRLHIPSTEIVDLSPELKDIPVLRCRPELKGKYSQHFSERDLDAVRSHRPDVLLRFGFNILRGEILTVAKYGVWSFHHADEQQIRGGPGAFWEIYRRMPVTGAILQRLTEKLDAGIILRKGFFPTIARSYRANLDQLLGGTTGWMRQALIDVRNGCSPALTGAPVQTNARVYTYPHNRQLLRAGWRSRIEKLKFHSAALFRPEKWNVGIVRQSPDSLLRDGIHSVEWLPEAPKGEYYADPFGWDSTLGPDFHAGQTFVFEHYSYRKEKGSISVIFNNGPVQPLLETNAHLSYPFPWTIRDDFAIIPESYQSGSVSIFPLVGPKQPIPLLKDFPGIDSSIVQWNGKFWIFCTKAGNLSNTELYLFHADKLFGPWQPHSNNPVKCDVRAARPAGTPFVLDGKLYRPAQDCSTTYGAAVVIHEIETLTETQFAERPVKRLEPSPSWKWNRGLHTLSVVSSNLLLIDAKRYAFNFDNFGRVLRRKLRRLLP